MPPIDDLARTLSQASRRTVLGTLIAAAVLPTEESAAKKKRKKKKKKSGSGAAPTKPTTTTKTTTPAPNPYACPPGDCAAGPSPYCGPSGSNCRCVGRGPGPGVCVKVPPDFAPACGQGDTCEHSWLHCLNTCDSFYPDRCFSLCGQ